MFPLMCLFSDEQFVAEPGDESTAKLLSLTLHQLSCHRDWFPTAACCPSFSIVETRGNKKLKWRKLQHLKAQIQELVRSMESELQCLSDGPCPRPWQTFVQTTSPEWKCEERLGRLKVLRSVELRSWLENELSLPMELQSSKKKILFIQVHHEMICKLTGSNV